MAGRSRVKTEHAGAKNGGGYYGRRAQAKRESNKHRRVNDRAAVAPYRRVRDVRAKESALLRPGLLKTVDWAH